MRGPCAVEGCEKQRQRGAYCIGHDPAIYHRAFLPSEPLVALVEARGGVTECGADKSLRRAYARAKRDGRLTELQADRLALELLSVHPWELWDSWFPRGVAQPSSTISMMET